MADSLTSIDKKCVFRETFESESNTRRLGGVPTTVTYSNGVASFNGSTSNIEVNKSVSGLCTFRIRFKSLIPKMNGYIFDCRQLSGASGHQYAYCSSATTLGISSGAIYVDGIVSSTISTLTKEIVVTSTISKYFDSFVIGNHWSKNNADFVTVDVELFEIYQGALTADEVKNLYENKRFREVSGHGEQLGAELVDQSNWYTAAWWTFKFDACWSQSGTTLVCNGTGQLFRWVPSVLSIGKKYKVSISVIRTSGTLQGPNDNTTYYQAITSSGTYVYYFTAASVQLMIDASSFVGSITALSIKEVVVNSTKEILSVNAFDGVCRNKYSGDVYGSELVSPLNFLSSWTNVGSATSTSTYVFTTTGSGGLTKSYLTIGKRYRIVLIGSISSNATFTLNNASSSGSVIYTNDSNTVINYSAEITAIHANLYLRIDSASRVVTITQFTIQELIPSVVNTSVEVVKENDVFAMKFNGSSSKIDCGSYDTLVGDKTFVAWVNLYKNFIKGTAASRSILSNNQVDLFTYYDGVVNRKIFFESNGATVASSALIENVDLDRCIIVTRTSTGIANIYIDGILSGSANQNSGTPVAGDTNIQIGMRATYGKFNNLISSIRILDGILTAQEIAQIYSSEKSLYGL